MILKMIYLTDDTTNLNLSHSLYLNSKEKNESTIPTISTISYKKYSNFFQNIKIIKYFLNYHILNLLI